ncbi:MAG: hypothetical protein SFY70_11690 [Bacteroidia bacterium]|nr:hypothetical protein [Bacteroidia bacterium]
MNDPRIVELLAEMVRNQDITNQRLVSIDHRLEKLEDQQAKTNLAIGELRLSVMHLAERIETLVEHEKRIVALEQAVFKT